MTTSETEAPSFSKTAVTFSQPSLVFEKEMLSIKALPGP